MQMQTYRSAPLLKQEPKKSGRLIVKLHSNKISILRDLRKCNFFHNSVLDSKRGVLSFSLPK